MTKHCTTLLLLLMLCLYGAAAVPEQVHPLKNLHEAGLVDVMTLPDVKFFLDIRYATPHNFTGKVIYQNARCFLHKEAADALVRAAQAAAQLPEPFTFCLWDCYRPLSAQKALWDAVPNPNYVAPPAKGSRHNRGMAVDLTPCDFTGTPLSMPTEFDSFTPQAHMDNYDLPAVPLKNRETLKKIMTAAGFTYTRTEWWHFDKSGWRTKPVLNIDIPPAQ